MQPCPDHPKGETYQERIAARPWAALYKEQRWLSMRRRFLDRNPICQCEDCRRDGPPQPARVVHHIVAHRGDRGLFYDWNNLMAMSKPCHDRQTARERHHPVEERGETTEGGEEEASSETGSVPASVSPAEVGVGRPFRSPAGSKARTAGQP
jgi:5-methylcytosine-specific restriction protein A